MKLTLLVADPPNPKWKIAALLLNGEVYSKKAPSFRAVCINTHKKTVYATNHALTTVKSN